MIAKMTEKRIRKMLKIRSKMLNLKEQRQEILMILKWNRQIRERIREEQIKTQKIYLIELQLASLRSEYSY